MGMAASQARFLGLTARKSNVEYQGQQVNQQRTSLANESANLYNQMMDLTVPTPPSTNDYYTTTFVLEDSAFDNGENYKFVNATKTYNTQIPNQYSITLSQKVSTNVTDSRSYALGAVTIPDSHYPNIKKCALSTLGNNSTGIALTYDSTNDAAYKKETKDGVDTWVQQNINKYQIYKMGYGTNANIKFPELELAQKTLNGNNGTQEEGEKAEYFYTDANGRYVYLTQAQLDAMFEPRTDETMSNVTFGTYRTQSEEKSFPVYATLETAEKTGRYTTITIAEDDTYGNLSGKTFGLDTVQEFDENAYNDAFNDYEYEKAEYEKAISDINSQTEIIQAEDQQLELRLQQLDTEQKAISTEIDSVTKVIEDNVDKTFKVFA